MSGPEPPNAPPSGGSGVDELGEQYLEALLGGKEAPALPAAPEPELAGALARRLHLIQRLHRAGQALSTRGVSNAAEPRVRCPHCGQRVTIPGVTGEQVPGQLPGIHCPACGSAFNLSHEGWAGSPPANELPAEIGRFAVLELLGRGAFGAVYKALDGELDRCVAVKVPRAGSFATEEDEERFLREARSAARLRHPAIVQVHEIGLDRGVPYIVSEYIQGQTLSQIIERGRPPFRESAELVARIAEALHHAHLQGVIHRDVKPGNILLDRNGCPHLGDFGLARRGDEDVTVTLDGQILGTPAYMPPEQALGDLARVSALSDQYSLGVVLYELLTGERPFRGSKSMLLAQVLSDEPRSPRLLNDHIPQDLETICLKAMAKEPGQRYASADALAQDLRRFLRSEPILARPISRAQRLLRWARRNPAVAILSAALGLVLIATTCVSTWLAVNTSAARDEAQGRLVRLNLSSGSQQAAMGNLLGALPWYAEACRLDSGDPERARSHALRLETTLESCPRLTHLSVLESSRPQSLRKVKFSRDGSQLLAWTDVAVARVQLSSGKAEKRQLALESGERVLELGLGGKALVTATGDGKVRARDPFEGGTLYEVPHGGRVLCATFGDGERFLATGAADRTARVWDAVLGVPVTGPIEERGPVKVTALDHRERRLLVVTGTGHSSVWSLPEGHRLAEGPTHTQEPLCGELSPDGRWAATAGHDRVVRIWDARTGAPQVVVGDFGNFVPRVRFSPDSRILLAVSGDGTAQLVDVASGARLGQKLQHLLGLTDGEVHPDASTVATAGHDGVLRIWDATTGQETGSALQHQQGVLGLAFSRDGRRVATTSEDGLLRIWDFAARSLLFSPQELRPWTRVAAISPDRAHLAIARSSGKVSVYSLPAWTEKRVELVEPEGVRALAWSPDCTVVAALAARPEVVLIPVSEESSVRSVALQGPGIHLAWARSGRAVAVASSRDGVELLDPGDASAGTRALPTGSPVAQVLFDPQGAWLAAGTRTGKVHLWDAASGHLLRSLDAEGPGVTCLGASPDGRLIAAGNSKGQAFLWEVGTGKVALGPLVHSQPLTHILFSPDATRVLTASHDSTAKLWRVRDGHLLAPELRHQGGILAADFSPDGRLFLLGSFDQHVSVWDAWSGEEVAPRIWHKLPLVYAAFGGSSTLVTVPQTGRGGLWALPGQVRPVDELIQLASFLSGRKIDGPGGFPLLRPAEAQAAWEELHARHPESFRTSQETARLWHLDQLERAMAGTRPQAVVVHATALRDLGENIPGDRDLLARALCAADEPGLGAREYARLDAREPLGRGQILPWALAHLLAEEPDQAARVCDLALQRYGKTGDPFLANEVAWTAASLPAGSVPLEPYLAVARSAAGAQPANLALRHTLGMLLLRTGRREEGAPLLLTLGEGEIKPQEAWRACALAFVLGELGRREEALRWLQLGESLLREETPAQRVPWTVSWSRTLELRRLLEEARAVIPPAPGPAGPP